MQLSSSADDTPSNEGKGGKLPPLQKRDNKACLDVMLRNLSQYNFANIVSEIERTNNVASGILFSQNNINVTIFAAMFHVEHFTQNRITMHNERYLFSKIALILRRNLHE